LVHIGYRYIYEKGLKEGKMARYTGPRIRIIRRLGPLINEKNY
jgi:hypothetical protein